LGFLTFLFTFSSSRASWSISLVLIWIVYSPMTDKNPSAGTEMLGGGHEVEEAGELE
jgi:hypothetical protein